MERLDKTLIEKAAQSLIAFAEKENQNRSKPNLFGNYSRAIFAEIQLVKNVANPIQSPIRVQVPHPFYFPGEEDHSICLFCRTEDKEAIEKFLESNPIFGLNKVLSVSQVKKYLHEFKDRKKLLNDFTHFYCDSRVFKHVQNLLGTVFTKGNHQAIPINFPSIDKLPGVIQKALGAAHFYLKGSHISIRLGLTRMPASEVANNILVGLENAVKRIPHEWSAISNIQLKMTNSPSLPLYSKNKSAALEFLKSKSGSTSEAPKAARQNKRKAQSQVDVVAPTPTPTPTLVHSTPTQKDKHEGGEKKVGNNKGGRVKLDHDQDTSVSLTEKPSSTPATAKGVKEVRENGRQGKGMGKGKKGVVAVVGEEASKLVTDEDEHKKKKKEEINLETTEVEVSSGGGGGGGNRKQKKGRESQTEREGEREGESKALKKSKIVAHGKEEGGVGEREKGKKSSTTTTQKKVGAKRVKQ